MTQSYYSEKLSAGRLMRCYELAPPAVQRYLVAEIEHVRHRLPRGGRVLELGCGYGRVLRELAGVAGLLVGIDISRSSLEMARDYVGFSGAVALVQMNGLELAFRESSFDLVCCIQNGISAFQVDQRWLLQAAVTATRPGGKVLFSSYAEGLWPDRLQWFRVQAAAGLVGEIDEFATGDGVIVCADGFKATTVSADEFATLAGGLGLAFEIAVVDSSSVFCEITP